MAAEHSYNTAIHDKMARLLEQVENEADRAPDPSSHHVGMPTYGVSAQTYGIELLTRMVSDLNILLASRRASRALALDMRLSGVYWTSDDMMAWNRREHHEARRCRDAWAALLAQAIEDQDAIMRAARRAAAGKFPARVRK